jgi:hypothetical protein
MIAKYASSGKAASRRAIRTIVAGHSRWDKPGHDDHRLIYARATRVLAFRGNPDPGERA